MNTGRHLRTVLLIYSFMIASSMTVFGQEAVWSPAKSFSRIPTARAVQRASFPKQHKLFRLNRSGLDQSIFSIVDSRRVDNDFTAEC